MRHVFLYNEDTVILIAYSGDNISPSKTEMNEISNPLKANKLFHFQRIYEVVNFVTQYTLVELVGNSIRAHVSEHTHDILKHAENESNTSK